jgi:aquaporin Z
VVGLDIFFFSFISGAAINPMRYLAPAVLSGYVGYVWLYWTPTFVGSAIVAMIYRKTILSKSKMVPTKSNLLSNRSNVNNKSSIDRIVPRDWSLR